MEKFERHKKIFDLNINSGGRVEGQNILVKLINGIPVMFVLTKSLDLHLGSGGHEEIRFSRNIQWDDELAVGIIRSANKKLSIRTYDKISDDIESAIINATKNFVDSSSPKKNET